MYLTHGFLNPQSNEEIVHETNLSGDSNDRRSQPNTV
jgi:hypothetical protein